MVSVQFANQLGWYAFISLLLLALLYLIRPKPRETTIPSLMFFIKTSGITKQNSFLRNFINNLLFLLQFLAISLLAFALTAPFISVPKESVEQDTVIVLDISASMQTQQNSETRFEKAVSMAKEKTAARTSIVLASNIPIVALEKGTKDKALNILSSISAKDTSSNIGDAMLMAANILGNKGKVIVISDMKPTDGLDIEAAKKALSSRGLDVELITVGGKAENIAIIDLKITKREIKAYVKNYGSKAKLITLALSDQKSKINAARNILPNSVEVFTFETPIGISELRIEEKDDLNADNTAYIIGPNTKKIRTLLITSIEHSNIRTALESSPDIELKTVNPPVIPSLDYDIVVMNGFSTELLLPGFFDDLSNKVKTGADVIIAAQENLDKANFKLMPVKLGNIKKNETEIEVLIDNQFTAGIEFGTISKYFEAKIQDSTPVLTAGNETPLMAVREEGNGKVVYYGIFDEASEFRNSVTYPIFWNKLVNYLYSSQDLSELNTKTDKIMAMEKQKAETPYGEIETSRLFFDKAGIYKIGDKRISAALLNEKESDVSSESSSMLQEGEQPKKSEEMARKSFLQLIAAIALFVIMLELLIAKIRGDI